MTLTAPDQRFRFEEGEVHFSVQGQGSPLVLVHGTPWSSVTWHRLASVLARSFTVYTYDFIGYGASEKRDGQRVGLDVQSRLFGELLNHWEIRSPSVVAHDIGGATVLRTHLLDGADFAKLVLIDVVAMAPWGSPFFTHVRTNEGVFAGVPAYIHQAIVEAYIKGALHAEIESEEFAALVSPWTTQVGQAAFYRQIAQATQAHTDEVEPLYNRIRCPVQILWGEHDSWIPVETGERLHRAIPNSQFHRLSNAGHLAQLENPVAVEGHVLEFLS